MIPALTVDELSRYSRHILLPEIAIDGQQKLKSASVLVVGAGGLGSPLCLYLTAAGIGTLGIIDNDVVDESNLQRQVLFTIDDLGRPKAECAATRLRQLNPLVKIQTYCKALTAENAMKIIDSYDFVIDGTDNFPTRYLVNDACVLLNKPNIYGSIFRFEGQATVFNFEGGPCYRCLYPEPPPPGMIPSCAEGGVLGVLPAVIASIQATEAIKIITNIGKTLNGRLLLYDALHLEFEELYIKKNKSCPVCGTNRTIDTLVDYDKFCGLNLQDKDLNYIEFSAKEVDRLLSLNDPIRLVDVREPYERAICNIKGSLHIPVQQIPENLHKLGTEEKLIFYCKTGGRSAKVCKFLADRGYTNIINLKGGIMAWAQDVDTTIKQY